MTDDEFNAHVSLLTQDQFIRLTDALDALENLCDELPDDFEFGGSLETLFLVLPFAQKEAYDLPTLTWGAGGTPAESP